MTQEHNRDDGSMQIRVSAERWEKAQRWELECWQNEGLMGWWRNILWPVRVLLGTRPRYRGDDWNFWWREQFDGYGFLPGRIESAIELGCGPFTNMRLIWDRCKADRLVLSDPLIRSYLEFPHTFPRAMYRKGLCEIDDHPIEACPYPDGSFGLVVMINVLDHVRDAEVCASKAAALVRPGGFLIVGQDLSSEEDLAANPGIQDLGHPIKIGGNWLNGVLKPGFEPLIDRVLPRERGRNPVAHYGTLLFAGRRSPDSRKDSRAGTP
jgi:SAM-dependent methyltransferase